MAKGSSVEIGASTSDQALYFFILLLLLLLFFARTPRSQGNELLEHLIAGERLCDRHCRLSLYNTFQYIGN